MVKNRAVQVRMTRTQHQELRATAERKGFSSLSAYLRYAALRQDRVLEEKIIEIHRHLLGDASKRKGRRRSGPTDEARQ
jgi:hypothetical protein